MNVHEINSFTLTFGSRTGFGKTASQTKKEQDKIIKGFISPMRSDDRLKSLCPLRRTGKVSVDSELSQVYTIPAVFTNRLPRMSEIRRALRSTLVLVLIEAREEDVFDSE